MKPFSCIIRLFLLALAPVFFQRCELAETPPQVLEAEVISEHITASRTLANHRVGVDYIVPRDISITGIGTVVKVEPGTEIQFEQDARLHIKGGAALDASGTAGEPITFTGRETIPGYWQGILFETISSMNKLIHCVVEYGGADNGFSEFQEGNVMVGYFGCGALHLQDCQIRHSSKFGLVLVNSCQLLSFEGNVLSDNQFPAVVGYESANYMNDLNTFTGNEFDAVLIQDCGTPSDISVHYQKLGVPYQIECSFNVLKDFVIDPGVELVFGQGAGIELNNGASSPKLDAIGTATQPIIMRGKESIKGYWEGLRINGGIASFQHCHISDAGTEGYYEFATIWTEAASCHVEVRDCIIGNSAGHGISLKSNSDFNADVETANTFLNITGSNVYFF